jgi:hypothetical protein
MRPLVGVLLIFLGTSDTVADELSTLQIKVLVFNYSAASNSSLAAAEREASRILSQAGVEARWVECPVLPTKHADKSCAAEVALGDVRVRILNHPEQNYFGDSIFGFTVQSAFASVYYNSALRMAKIDNSDFEMPVILGSVIVHEIGHLLLGPKAHSASGIMQAEWKREQLNQLMKGRLSFTPEQAKIIQAEAAFRHRFLTATVASNFTSN